MYYTKVVTLNLIILFETLKIVKIVNFILSETLEIVKIVFQFTVESAIKVSSRPGFILLI